MPFEEAEQTLREAGFVVQPRSKGLLSPRLQVVAEISPYATSLFGLNGRTNVAVFLEPVTQYARYVYKGSDDAGSRALRANAMTKALSKLEATIEAQQKKLA